MISDSPSYLPRSGLGTIGGQALGPDGKAVGGARVTSQEPQALGERRMENKIRFWAAIIFMCMAGYPAFMNGWGVISNVRNRRRGIDKHYSPGPVISAVLAVIAYIVYPFTPKGWIFIIPAMDIGNWMVLIGLPVAIMGGAFKGAFTFKKGPPKQPSERRR